MSTTKTVTTGTKKDKAVGNVDNQDSNKGDEESQGGSKESDKQTNGAVDPKDWPPSPYRRYDDWVLRVAMGGGSAAPAVMVRSPDNESAVPVPVPVGSKMQLARAPVWQVQRE